MRMCELRAAVYWNNLSLTVRKLLRWIIGLFGTAPGEPVAPAKRVFVTREVLDLTARLVSSYRGPDGQHEGIVYWVGVSSGANSVVTTVIAPDATTSPGSYRATAVANALVVAKVDSLKLQVLAQVHGHPGPWVGHSDGDNDGAFMPYKGFYSVVVPNYGRNGLFPLTICGIHHFDGRRFQELNRAEVERQFIVVPSDVDLRRRNAAQPHGR
jgi:hypothetical protein